MSAFLVFPDLNAALAARGNQEHTALQERASQLPWTGADPEREEHLLNPLKLGQSLGWGRSLAGKIFLIGKHFLFSGIPFPQEFPLAKREKKKQTKAALVAHGGLFSNCKALIREPLCQWQHPVPGPCSSSARQGLIGP